MYLWNSKEAEFATNGISSKDWQGRGVVIDSRKISKGNIFVALKGDNSDGHLYAKNAIESGAAVAIVSRDVEGTQLLVDDTTKALTSMARFQRSRYQNKVIAVTGSSGKTTTKEQLLKAFTALGPSYATIGNYNNELGVPITMANLDLSSEYAIFEMGMSAFGEISRLSDIVKPDISIITNISEAHIEFFSSSREIAKAKAEIFHGTNKQGFAIINIDCNHGDYLISLAREENIANIISFGKNDKSHSKLLSYEEKNNICYIKADIMGKIINYSMQTNGVYFAINSLATLSAIEASGGDLEKSAHALGEFSALKGRGKKQQIEFNGKIIKLVDGSYNANPGSVKSSIAALGDAPRKIAILSDMKELGDASESLHLSLKESIISNNILLISVGPMMKILYDSLDSKNQLTYYDNLEQAIENIAYDLQNQDLVLVKGSHSTAIYKLVDHLLSKHHSLQEVL